MTRREMREHCFKMLFGVGFYPAEEAAQQAERYFESPNEDDTADNGNVEIIHQVDMKEADRLFLTDRVEKMAVRIPELDKRLNEVAQGWKTRRMGKVELTILRQALYEMIYDNQVPEKVAINEAVDLAKKYGGKDSPAFINGILAKLVTAE
ncbi:MAG: transcription antitermination factor NusB [Lachnospiraceae bacterium]|nr:transcription antitermination factor NusB [Lachnospiraceae bacterium]